MALLVLAIFPLLGVAQGLQMKFLAGVAGKDAKEMENSGKVRKKVKKCFFSKAYFRLPWKQLRTFVRCKL